MTLLVRVKSEGVGNVEKDIGRLESAGSSADKSLSSSMQSIGSSLTDAGKKMTTFATVPIVGAGVAIAKLAGDGEAAMTRFSINFGDATGSMNGFLEDLQKKAPASMTELRNAASGAQGSLTTLGVEQGKANEMTEEALEVASNLSSHMNIPFTDALSAVQAGYAGNTDSLRNMAYNINQAEINSKALELGLIDQGDSADGAARAQAVHALVMEQSSGIMDAAERQAGTFNMQMRRLWARVQDAGAALGKNLLPVLTPVANWLGTMAEKVGNLSPAMSLAVVVVGAFVAAIGPLLLIAGTLVSAFGSLMVFMGTTGVAATFAAVGVSIGSFLLAAAPVVAVVAALAAAGYLIYKNWGTISAAVAPVVAVFRNFASIIGGVFTGNLEQARASLANLPAPLQRFGEFLGNSAGRLRTFVNAVKTGFSQLRGSSQGPLSVVGRILRVVLGGALKFALQNVAILVNFFRSNMPLIKQTVQTVLGAVGALFRFNFRVFSTIVRAAFAVIRTVVTTGMRVVGAVVRAGLALVTGYWRTNSTQLMNIARAVWSSIKTVIRAALRVVLGVVKAGMQLLTGDWRGALNTLRQTAQTVWRAIQTLIKNALTIIVNIARIAFNNLKAVTKAAFNAIRDGIQSRLQKARELGMAAINALKDRAIGAWRNLRDRALEIFQRVRDNMVNPMQTAGERIRAVLKTITGVVAGVLGAFGKKGLAAKVRGSVDATANVASFGGGGTMQGSPVRSFAKGGTLSEKPHYVTSDTQVRYGERLRKHRREREYMLTENMSIPGNRKRNFGLWSEYGQRTGFLADGTPDEKFIRKRADHLGSYPDAPGFSEESRRNQIATARFAEGGSLRGGAGGGKGKKNPGGGTINLRDLKPHSGVWADHVARAATAFLKVGANDVTTYPSHTPSQSHAIDTWVGGSSYGKRPNDQSKFMGFADWVRGNAGGLNAEGVIASGKMAYPANSSWRPYPVHGSDTLDHYDHVHVGFLPGWGSGVVGGDLGKFHSPGGQGGGGGGPSLADEMWEGGSTPPGNWKEAVGKAVTDTAIRSIPIIGPLIQGARDLFPGLQKLLPKNPGKLVPGFGGFGSGVMADALGSFMGGYKPWIKEFIYDKFGGDEGGPGGPASGNFSGSQKQVALEFAKNAKGRGMPGRLPVMTALQESGMRNLDYGHGTSVGYFQLIDTHGSKEWRMNPANSLGWFLDGAEKFKGRYDNSPTGLGAWAQAVQASAHPGLYAQHWNPAGDLIGNPKYYEKGGLATGPQLLQLAERGKELVLPLENAQVMRSAQTALGTAELRSEIAELRSALVGKLDDVNLGGGTREDIKQGGYNSARNLGYSREGTNIAKQNQSSILTRSELAGSRR